MSSSRSLPAAATPWHDTSGTNYFHIALAVLLVQACIRLFAQCKQRAVVALSRAKPTHLEFITQKQWKAAQAYAADHVALEIKHEVCMPIIVALLLAMNVIPTLWHFSSAIEHTITLGGYATELLSSYGGGDADDCPGSSNSCSAAHRNRVPTEEHSDQPRDQNQDTGAGLLVSTIFLLLVQIGFFAVKLPFDAYSTLVVERKHGFSTQTPAMYTRRIWRMVFMRSLFGMPVIALSYWVVLWAGRRRFVVYLWVALAIYSLFMTFVYRPLHAHFLFRNPPMKTGTRLWKDLEALARQVSFPLKGLDNDNDDDDDEDEDPKKKKKKKTTTAGVLPTNRPRTSGIFTDSHAHNSHSNAYVTSVCGVNRIIVEQTLLKQVDRAQVVAAVAHEMGHWYHMHWLSMLAYKHVSTLVLVMSVGYIINDTSLYDSFGYIASGVHHQEQYPLAVGFVLSMFVTSPLMTLLALGSNALTRFRERQADAFAARHGHGFELRACLIKLQIENRDEFESDWLYSLLNDSHPALLQRLEHIERISVSASRMRLRNTTRRRRQQRSTRG